MLGGKLFLNLLSTMLVCCGLSTEIFGSGVWTANRTGNSIPAKLQNDTSTKEPTFLPIKVLQAYSKE